LGIPGWLDDSKKKGFQFLHVFVVLRQINAEAIPFTVVAVTQMAVDSAHEIARKPDVIELAASPIEGIDAGPSPNQLAHRVGIVIQNLPGNSLEVLHEQLTSSCHRLYLQCKCRHANHLGFDKISQAGHRTKKRTAARW
jgi:hypothetical protein